jgi:hypothetical protein
LTRSTTECRRIRYRPSHFVITTLAPSGDIAGNQL